MAPPTPWRGCAGHQIQGSATTAGPGREDEDRLEIRGVGKHSNTRCCRERRC
jgi:hypothetical protein